MSNTEYPVDPVTIANLKLQAIDLAIKCAHVQEGTDTIRTYYYWILKELIKPS